MNKERQNLDFDINTKYDAIIQISKEIINNYNQTHDGSCEPPGYICLAYDVKNYLPKLQQENKELKEIHYLIQGGRGNGKTYLTKLQQQLDLYKSVIDEIKGIVEETNYLANKTEIVNCGNIELHGVIDRLCLILRRIEIIDKAKESEESEIENN